MYDKVSGAFRYDIKFFTNILSDLDVKIKAWIDTPEARKALHVKMVKNG